MPKPWAVWLGWLSLLTACHPGMDLHFALSLSLQPGEGGEAPSLPLPGSSPASPVLGLCLPRFAAAPGPPGSPCPGKKTVGGKCNPSHREQAVLLEADKDLRVIKSSLSLSHSAHGETEALRGDAGRPLRFEEPGGPECGLPGPAVPPTPLPRAQHSFSVQHGSSREDSNFSIFPVLSPCPQLPLNSQTG